ncbi:hypothetical protein CC1G_02625 [Coprinopsis cinerea okayama7|uniref:Six-hairpin glycosidase n=1 Tax=Coprinopsis cinerea (strain Okayama-7 / 130 / ATCC MYA-4618 / FGSC 9003) TaxID=240176 RepID=A8PBE3_COPC7|nr:hypothetical protein CC1G_02625 [Coprinopsis cinerea okayama7\|eukprot:XP_001840162.2 hypothetical protein CC1G_02625 [Coprinopsis cinerea okayama7\
MVRTLGTHKALLILIVGILTFLHLSQGQELSNAQIETISERLRESAQASWEIGTRAQAILELNATTYSVFSGSSLPPPSTVPDDVAGAMQPLFDIARGILEGLNPSQDNPQPLMQDGSAADPAANGITILLANWTQQDDGNGTYAKAAQNQLAYLYSDAVPKTGDGAISHRVDQLQLWSDFVYMVPPFLAYYGVTTSNRTLLTEAFNQVRLYRSYLRDNETGMWRHILLGESGNDEGYWTTGNGWAAAGMLRVHATMQNSQYSNSLQEEQFALASWVAEIHEAIYPHLAKDIFTNYADQPASSPGNFHDAASTALLAATVYRASAHLHQHTHIPSAERSRRRLFSVDAGGRDANFSSLEGYNHFSPDGWLTPVVNPHQYGEEGSQSAEGQAFVLMLHAAYNEWKEDGRQGSDCSWDMDNYLHKRPPM